MKYCFAKLCATDSHKIGTTRPWLGWLVVCTCVLYTAFVVRRSSLGDEFLKGDCVYYKAVVVSLVEDRDFLVANNISANPLDGQLALGRKGLVPKHPILMPIVSIPFYIFYGDRGLLLFNIVACIVLMVLIFKINCFFANCKISFITTLLYAAGTLFLEYSYNYSPDIFSTVLLLWGIYLVLRGNLWAGAFILGLSVFAKVTNAPLVIIIITCAIIWIYRGNFGDNEIKKAQLNNHLTVIGIIIAFVISLIPFAAMNFILFGSPFVTGYQRMAIADSISGHTAVINHLHKFNQPFFRGVLRLIADPNIGIFTTNPIVILSLPGTFLIRRMSNRRVAYLLLLVCFVQLLIFAKYDDIYASHYSNRFMMTFVALSSVFAAAFLDYIRTRLLAGRMTPRILCW